MRSTLALMDAGVPLSAPVAGISCGLITEGDRWMTMVDIQGVEDFFGDMDFKVAGTHNGITAIQVDMKVEGISFEIIADALENPPGSAVYPGRDYAEGHSRAEEELSKYAPKMLTLQIHPDKIREVIGSAARLSKRSRPSAMCILTLRTTDGSLCRASISMAPAARWI